MDSMSSELKMWDVVVVSWVDAVTQHGAYNAKDYVKGYRPVLRRSIGYFIGKSCGHIHMSATDDRSSREYDNADEVTSIPYGMVTEVTLLAPQETLSPDQLNKQLKQEPRCPQASS
jgi:hypothetical protein